MQRILRRVGVVLLLVLLQGCIWRGFWLLIKPKSSDHGCACKEGHEDTIGAYRCDAQGNYSDTGTKRCCYGCRAVCGPWVELGSQ